MSLAQPLANGAHGQLDNSKGTSADGHGTNKSRRNASEEASGAVGLPGLSKARAHRRVLLVSTEAVGLHLALDDVEGVRSEPESLTSQTTVQGNLPAGDFLAIDAVASSVEVHHVLERGEPGAVGKRLTEQGDGCAAVDALGDTALRGDLLDAVERAVVEAGGAMGLTLQADTDVLDGRRQHRVGNTGKRTGKEVLPVREARLAGGVLVACLEPAAGRVVGAKLDGDAGTDTNQRREGAFVEGERAFGLVDGRGGLQGARVLGGGLETDLDDVEGLACGGGGWLGRVNWEFATAEEKEGDVPMRT